MRALRVSRVFHSVILIALIILAGCATAPLRSGQDVRRITLLATGDFHGLMEPSDSASGLSEGGIARIASLIKEIRAESEHPVLAISTGDSLMGRYFHVFRGRAIFRLMTAAGYDLCALGNHEFDKGPKVLADALKTAGFETLCTDLNLFQTPLEGLCRPWIIRNVNGLAVGFFSLMTEDFPLVTSGAPVQLNAGNVPAAQKAVQDLRRAGAKLIIAVNHIGLDRDRALAERVPGIDLIIGGHSHDLLSAPLRIGNTMIVHTGEGGVRMVRLDLAVNAHGGIEPGQSRYELIPVDGSVPEDPEVLGILNQYRSAFPPAIVLGHTGSEWNLTSDLLRKGESPVVNMINDLLKKKFRADIVFNNAGAFRGKRIYPPGPVTDQMLQEIDEFSNLVYFVSLKGRDIPPILERSAASFGEGGLLHASGLRYRIDLNQPAQQIAQNDQGQWHVIRAGNRVSDVRVQDVRGEWRALNPDQTYTVLSNDFLINREGDGYFWFKESGENFRGMYSTIYSILAEAIGQTGVLNPEKPDGRLTILP